MTINPKDFLVLDVETNGLSAQQYDLLSISIYQPDSGKIYNRFLPLELNRSVLTTQYNGITDDDLKNETQLVQDEVDNLILEFQIDSRTILTYGNLDERFIKAYFKRKKLSGFEKFKFYNYKRNIIASSFSGGNVTKDNLCKIYGIENIKEVHTGENDCILQWKLFEAMNKNKLFVIGRDVFEFNSDYIVPISYISTYPNFKYHIPKLPTIHYSVKPVEKFVISNRKIKKFPTNFNGVIIEHLLNSMLSVKKVNSLKFLSENKKKLKYIGKLPSAFNEVYLNFKSDGTVSAVDEKDDKLVKELNKFIEIIKKEIQPVVDFINKQIFIGDDILSQELVVNKEANILALCDLSNNHSILEIKTNSFFDLEKYKLQLYYQSNGRRSYILQASWNTSSKKIEFILSELIFNIADPALNILSLFALKDTLKENNIFIKEYLTKIGKLNLQCSDCNYEWITSYNNTLKSYCENCYQNGRTSKMHFYSLDDKAKLEIRSEKFKQDIMEKSNNMLEVIAYSSYEEPATARCLKCGRVRTVKAERLLKTPYCTKCKLENN